MLIWGIGLLVVVAVLVVIGIAISGGGDGNTTDSSDESPTTAVAQAVTNTDVPEPTQTDAPEPFITPIPIETETLDIIAAAQQVLEQQTTQVIIDNSTATAARTTLDYSLQETESANLTVTATFWTPTPTPNVTASVEAVLTSWAYATATQAASDMTATATLWTNTPTPIPTRTPDATATLIAFRPLTNNDWTPVEQDFDGVTMVLVPAGCFDMGSDTNSDEQPVHQICFDEPFWIDKYEVTNAQFGSVARSSGCSADSSDPNQPRNCVSWFEASDFCESREARLPTEAEWEYAARGVDGWVYPWGDTYDATLVIGVDDPTYSNRSTAPVGSRPRGASWVGAMDMSGNVWEWVSSLYVAYPYDETHESNIDTNISRVLRGGSFGDATGYLRSAYRGGNIPSNNYLNLGGFRCVRSFDGETASTSSTETDQSTTTSHNAALELAQAGAENNADWTPIEQDFNGVTMMLVPAGCFDMGSEERADEQPIQEICFDQPFWIDKFEVTNEQFGSVGCESWSSEPDQPSNCVTWFEASDFCEARDARLPTEAEWEYAARGVDGWVYPWGNEFVGDKVVYSSNSGDETAPVGNRPRGASWVGAMVMSGNVWEWVSSLNIAYPYDETHESYTDINGFRVLRGGSFFDYSGSLRSAYRFGNDPSSVLNFSGFRCARSSN